MTSTDKDKLIEELRTEIETLKAIISKMPGNVYWRNTEGKYLGSNLNNAALLKLKNPDDIIGKTLVDLVDPSLAAAIDKMDFEIMRTGKETRIEELGYDSRGNPAYYLSHKSPLFNKEGKTIGLLGLSVNITDQKRAQELLRIAKKKAEMVSRAKSQFLSMISHELRTPLTSILGFIRFLEKGSLSKESEKECLKNITQSGSYLLSLVNNILDYNKLEAGKLNLTVAPFNLKETVTEVLNILSGSAKAKLLPLQFVYDDTLPTDFISDNNAIKQLLINLISNAIKFTEKGHVLVKIENLQTSNQNATLKISVIDTGIGIPKDEIRTVFKRFHQLDNTYTRKSSLTGTGLGLSIVKNLVTLLGSKIKVESTLHKGSTFYFTLQLQRNVPLHNTKQDNLSSSTHEKSQAPKILLIEDDEMIQIIHKRLLEEFGCRIQTASNAATALQKISEPFDLLFVDIGLPDMNGFDLIKAIRKKNHKMPIIALTGFSEEREKKRCLKVGANYVLIKPVSQENFQELLEKYLAYSRNVFK